MAVAFDRPAEDTLYVSFPITKFERDADGDLIVFGKASDGTVDTDEQIVHPDWAKKAFGDWHDTGGNIRMSHDPRKPVGRSLAVEERPDGHYVKSLVVDRDAQRLVEKGVLRAYSVGISRPLIERDISGKARGGIIKGGELAELSLVDRPANKNCTFTVLKADGAGGFDFTGELLNAAEALAKITTPADLVKAAAARRDAGRTARIYADPVAQRLSEALAADAPPEFTVKGTLTAEQPLAGAVADVVSKRVTASGRVVDSSGQDRSDVAGGDFAGPGKTFPIEVEGDVSDAASLAHHAKNPAKVRSRIRAIARRKFPGMTLPPSLAGAKGDSDEPFAGDEGLDLAGIAKAIGDGSLDEYLAARMLRVTADELKGSASSSDDCDDDDMPDKAADDLGGSKAGKPFGGKKSPPFGKKKPKAGAKDPDGDADADDVGSKVAALQAQVAALQAELAKHTPTAVGVTGMDSKPVPQHRGGGSMECGPDVIHPDQPWGKTQEISRVTEAPYAAQRAHDATCAAYDPALVKGTYPALAHPGLACDPSELQEEALKAIASGDLSNGEGLLAAAQAAGRLHAADALAVKDAMAGLHKMFTDMYPSVRLSPGKVSAQQFRRPYITDGHARVPALSGPSSPHDIASYQPDAADFRRGALTAGEAAPSPGNKGDSGLPAGSPASAIYQHAQQAQEASADLRTIHDHYAARWNGVCPMSPHAGPVTPGGLAKASKKKKAKKPPAMLAPMDPVPAMPDAGKAASPEVVMGDITVLLAQVERQLRKLAKRDAETAELTKSHNDRIVSQAAEIDELRRSVTELGSQAEPLGAPPRSVVSKASSVMPAERRSLVDEAGERHRAGMLAWAQSMAASGDPVTREAGERQMRRLLTTQT